MDSDSSCKNIPPSEARCCYDPIELFSLAAAIALLIFKNFNICQIETIINLITMISSDLTGLVTQVDINSGQQVEPPF